MPGLLDSLFGNQGLLGGGGADFLNSMAATQNPSIQQNRIQQQQLQANYNALVPQYGPQAAMIMTLHPSILEQQYKPEKLGPGDTLVSPMSLGGLGAQQQPQQGGLPQMPQQPGMPQQGGAQPGPPQQGGAQTLAANNNGLIDDAAAKNMAEQILLGDREALQKSGFGMGAIGNINKSKVQNAVSQLMKERGITPGELSARAGKFPAYEAAQKQLGELSARMGTAGIEFQKIWPQFRSAMEQFNPSQFPSFNAFRQFVAKQTGSAKISPIDSYVNSLANIYVRAISTNQRGPTEGDKSHIRDVIDKHWNMGQLDAAGGALNNEIQAAHDSVPAQMNVLKVRYGLADKAPAAMKAEAQDAIKRGAPHDKIIQRINEAGYDASELK